MRHVASLTLHAHWESLRAGRAAPGWNEIDLVAVRDVLASVFLLDATNGSIGAVFRLSGTRLDALFGRPLRGSAFDRVWSARSAAALASALNGALDGARPTAAVARGGPPRREATEFELLLLPLDGGRQALGSLAALSSPGWMGLAAAAPLDLLPGDDRRTSGAGGFGRRRAAFPPRPVGRGTTTPTAAPSRVWPRAVADDAMTFKFRAP